MRKQKITKYNLSSKGVTKGSTLAGLVAYQRAKADGKTAVIVAKDEAAKVRICISHNVDPRDVVLKSDLTNEGRIAAIRQGAH